jgi:hypothetical protein
MRFVRLSSCLFPRFSNLPSYLIYVEVLKPVLPPALEVLLSDLLSAPEALHPVLLYVHEVLQTVLLPVSEVLQPVLYVRQLRLIRV